MLIYMNNTTVIPQAIRIITTLLGSPTWTGNIGKAEAATWKYTGGDIGVRYYPASGELLVSVQAEGSSCPAHILNSYEGQDESLAKAEAVNLLSFLRSKKGIV
jgi:hypothetical protein